MPPLERRLGRLAALAGPEAGPLRVGGRQMEPHVLGLRQARRAGRPAVDAGGPHRVEERAVGIAIARDDGRPAGIFLGPGGSMRWSRSQSPHLVFSGCLNHHAPTIAGATIARTSLLAIESGNRSGSLRQPPHRRTTRFAPSESSEQSISNRTGSFGDGRTGPPVPSARDLAGS